MSLSLERKENRRSSRSEIEATIKEKMNTESQTTTPVSTTSCKKHVNDDNATFLANLKGRFSEFVNTPMDEHMTCFKNTMDKVRSQFSTPPLSNVCTQLNPPRWRMSKDGAQKKVDEVKKVESHSPL